MLCVLVAVQEDKRYRMLCVLVAVQEDERYRIFCFLVAVQKHGPYNILSVVLYVCGTWYGTGKEEKGLGVLKNTVLGETWGSRGGGGTRGSSSSSSVTNHTLIDLFQPRVKVSSKVFQAVLVHLAHNLALF
jgi:hypothetical protein